MVTDKLPSSASIVVEWYNMSYAELERPKRMLEALRAEAKTLRCSDSSTTPHLSGALELLVVFNSNAVDSAAIQNVLADLINANDLTVRTIPIADATYCEMKNAGAENARGDIVIFLDCDVVPEPGWLAAFLRAFADPNVSAAVGNTYTDFSNGATYSKAMALSWMFPLREIDDGMRASASFHSNNAAFRRETFLARRFPHTQGLTHFPAALLVERLKQDGIPIWLVGGARASHPAPNGARHFVARAVAAGRARVFSAERSARSTAAWVRQDIATMLYHSKQMVIERSKVGLRCWQIPAAIVYAVSYDALLLMGSILSVAAPGLMRNRFVL